MLEDFEQADLAERIREYCRERKGRLIPIGEITKAFERKIGDLRKLKEIIWHVESTGDIAQVEAPPGPGRPTIYFTWNKSSVKNLKAIEWAG
jgi:hypothetical protein